MAHEISTESEARGEMFYAGKEPWHGLGQYVGDRDITAREAILAAGLDWAVEKRPAFYKKADGTFAPNGGFVTVRKDTDKCLGRVGSVYTVLQNEEGFKWLDGIVGPGRACFHTAGALGKGERVWILVRLAAKDEITPGDEVESYLLISNSHDGNSPVDIRLTTVRVVCANTLGMALSSSEKGKFFRIRHTTSMEQRIHDAGEALAAVDAKFRKFIEAGRLLAGEPCSKDEIEEFLVRLELQVANAREEGIKDRVAAFKRTEKYGELVSAFKSAPGAQPTLWGAVNAVSYYYDHVAKPKDTGKYESVQERRWASGQFDGGADKKERALALALEFAQKR